MSESAIPPIRVASSAGYRWRLLFVGALGAGLACWFLYDGFVKYPLEREIAAEYRKFVDENRVTQWPEYARERGWPDGLEGQPGVEHSDSSILLQRGLGFVVLPLALLFVISGVRTMGRWLTYDEETGLATSWGVRIPLTAITAIDKQRWQRKGIAVVHYTYEGKTGRLVLDDWKYDEQATETLLKVIENHLQAAANGSASAAPGADA